MGSEFQGVKLWDKVDITTPSLDINPRRYDR